MTWYGTTTGSNTTTTYTTVSSEVVGQFTLAGIRFYAVDPATYTIAINGTTVATITSPGGQVEEAAFTAVPSAPPTRHAATITITTPTPVRVRTTTGSSYTYYDGVTQGPFIEGTGRLPFELDLTPAHPTEWVVSCPGVVTGSPHAMPGVVVNGGTGTPTRTVGQLWPTYHGAP